MKCQSMKHFKNTHQSHFSPPAENFKDRSRFFSVLAQQNVNHHLRGKDQNLLYTRQETHNVHDLKPSSNESSLSSSPTFGPFYAGAKFSGAPSPTDLPKPPSHWTVAPLKMSSGGVFPVLHGRVDKHHDFANRMKMLVNAPA